MKKALDEKYSYQIDENNIVHLFRGEEDCQQLLTNPLLSAIFKIEKLETQIEKMKCCENCQTVRDAEGNCYLKKDGKCKNLSKWELKEK